MRAKTKKRRDDDRLREKVELTYLWKIPSRLQLVMLEKLELQRAVKRG